MSTTPDIDRSLVAVYDAGCGFCTAAVDWVRRHDRRERVGFVPIDDTVIVHGCTLRRPAIDERMHAVDTQGHVHTGFAAWRRIARELPVLRPLRPLLAIPGVDKLGELAYTLVANNRTRISRRLGLQCRIGASCRANRP